MLMDHVDPERDVLDLIPIEEEGVIMNLKRGGAHGYWTIQYPKGPLPQMLQGQYTNKALAEQDARNYIKHIRRTPAPNSKQQQK